jgi:hypothetical protein
MTSRCRQIGFVVATETKETARKRLGFSDLKILAMWSRFLDRSTGLIAATGLLGVHAK